MNENFLWLLLHMLESGIFDDLLCCQRLNALRRSIYVAPLEDISLHASNERESGGFNTIYPTRISTRITCLGAQKKGARVMFAPLYS